MEYLYSKNRSTAYDLLAELRINLIRVNNAYCGRKLEETGKWVIDLSEIFEDYPDVLVPFIDPLSYLALLIEGMEELIEGKEDLAIKEYKKMIEQVKEKMAKLPPI